MTYLMTIYNILFPFLILLALGIAIFILTKHLPEAVEHAEVLDKEEKKRWWQILLGKGENILRSLRVLLLRLDNKLNVSIKKVRERKEEMGKGFREYGTRNHERLFKKNPTDVKASTPTQAQTQVQTEPAVAMEYSNEGNQEDSEPTPIPAEEPQEQEHEIPDESSTKKNRLGKFANKMSSVFHKKEPRIRAVEEILKKTFTPAEIKVEKEQYWKKKEELLIQSIVREPKNVGLYLQLGRLYSTQHNWKDARNAFLEVLKLDKTNVKAKEELKRIDKNINE